MRRFGFCLAFIDLEEERGEIGGVADLSCCEFVEAFFEGVAGLVRG